MILSNKKSMMHLSIVLFVFATLVLIITALAAFYLNANKINAALGNGVGVQEVYVRAEILNFYLRNICGKLNSAANPTENFKTEFEKYQDASGSYAFPYMRQIISQIDSKHISTDGKKVSVSFDIVLVDVPGGGDNVYGGISHVSYSYTFKCSKTLV